MDEISSMFRNVDNAVIISMMEMQGISMTEEILNMIKTHINPEMMKIAANTPTEIIPSFSSTMNVKREPFSNSTSENQNMNTDTNSNNNSKSTNNPSSGVFPDIGNIDMSKAMEYMNKNPQIRKMMAPHINHMFGGGGGNGNGDGNSNSDDMDNLDPNLMMNTLQNIIWFLNLITRINQFLLSIPGRLFLFAMVVLIGSYFSK